MDGILEVVHYIKDSVDNMKEENAKAHESILREQKKTNGTVRTLNEAMFSPECPDEGLVNRHNLLEKRVAKIDKRLFRFSVIATPIIFLCGLLGGQWLEELLRETPLALNGLMQWLGRLF